jgi:hypothetical protein
MISAKDAYKTAGLFNKIKGFFKKKTIDPSVYAKNAKNLQSIAEETAYKNRLMKEKAIQSIHSPGTSIKTNPDGTNKTVIRDAVHSEQPNKVKEHLQTYWPHYAVAGAAGIGGLAYLRKKNRDKQNAAA